MTGSERSVRQVLLSGLLVLFIAMAIGFGLGVSTARAEGLEVDIVEETSEGPLLEWTHGCYEYGGFYASVVQGRGQGIPMAHYLALVRDAPDRDKVPGMANFLLREIAFIYVLPKGFLKVPFKTVRQRAIDMCRTHGGKTWAFRKKA
jgi:hypothetical protein